MATKRTNKLSFPKIDAGNVYELEDCRIVIGTKDEIEQMPSEELDGKIVIITDDSD